jgi:hypothetical protein
VVETRDKEKKEKKAAHNFCPGAQVVLTTGTSLRVLRWQDL